VRVIVADARSSPGKPPRPSSWGGRARNRRRYVDGHEIADGLDAFPSGGRLAEEVPIIWDSRSVSQYRLPNRNSMRQFEERIETIDASTGPLNATRSADYGCWIRLKN
jgi:hypothetical protein